MGQTIGKACIHPGARPFVNLPKSSIDTLRQSVNEVAEGFGLSRDELKQIVHLSLQEYIRILDSTTLDKCSEALFTLFQANATETTKEQDEALIDSFEFLATISIVSGMQLDEKIYFLFDLFDVSESGFLNFNEATLAFRLLASGTSKIAQNQLSLVQAIDRLVLKGFEFSSKEISKYSKSATVVEEYRMNKHDFFHYVFNCSETMSFLTCFDDIVVEERPRQSSIGVEEKKPTSLHFDVQDIEETPLSQPWRDTLRLLPTSTDEETPSSPPSDGLTLDWIYGRNPGAPARYCTNGDVVYAAGSVVVKVSTNSCGKSIQEYFMGHACHVTSIDVIPVDGGVGDLVASADVGFNSKICVWSSITLQPIVAIPCLSKSGFSKIVFSPTGKLLMAIGNADRTITVYDWRERTIVYSSESPGSHVYDCSFLSGDTTFALCTDIGVYLWIQLEQNMPFSRHSGVFNRLPTRETMTSIAIVEETVVTVSFSGRVWAWEGRVCTKLMTHCSGPVTRLFVPRTRNSIGLCLSTQGGSVQLLGRNFELLHTFVPNKGFDDSERTIDIVCVHPVLDRVLVGQNHSLYQMDMTNKGDLSTISSGHPKIHGISMRHHNVITVGNDRIKIWDAEQHAVVREARIGEQLSCVSYNQQEDQIAIGFRANSSRSSSDKSFIILSGDDLQSIHHGCNSLQTLTACMYSKDGKLLAFGSADASIYIHQTTAKFPLFAQLRGHKSPISVIDFGCDIDSLSASYLRSNTACGEAMFWTTQGKIQTPLSQKDTVWESHTCIYTECLEGVHNSYENGSSRVSSCCISSTPKGHSILIGSNDGNIRAFSHPSSAKLPLYLEYNGHSGAVRNIQAAKDSEIVYTVSHKDVCMFQWKQAPVSWDQGLPIANMKNERPFSDESPTPEMNMDSVISQMDSFDFSSTGTSPDVTHKQRSWKRSIVAPSYIPPCDGELPASNLILERIHGYSGFNARNNLHHLCTGNVVYNIGKVLVRYDVENDKQYFYMANRAISHLSIHRGRSVCAIGHDGESPAITIVDLKDMRPLSLLNEYCRRVVCLDFDESGDYLVAVGKCKDIVVYDWKKDTTIATSRTHGLETLDVKFLKGSSTRIIECGVCFVRFWSIKGCALSFQEMMLDSSINHIQYYSCIGWNGDHALVGTSTGCIIQFDGTESGREIQAHQSEVINIATVKNGFISSSSDSVKVWDTSMRCALSFNTQQLGIAHSIVSSCWADESVFVGTSGNEIWQLSSSKGSNLNGTGKVLVRSHSSSPLGISVSSSNSFATSGDDGVLSVWNLFDHQKVHCIDLDGVSSRSCAFSPHQLGTLIAVGFGKPVKDNARTVNGKWIVLSVADDGSTKILAERRDVKKYITTMKWHSYGDRLAVGSGDHKICVYSILTDTEPATALDITLLSMIDLTSTPIHFDFSRDGKYLKVNTESYDLNFFEAGPGIHIKEPSKLKDMQWETETCIFGWHVQGVWDEEEVSSLDSSVEQESPMIAYGTLNGNIKLSKFPCLTKNAQCLTYPAHLGPVHNVSWLPGYLISTGEKDNAIMIWRQQASCESTGHPDDHTSAYSGGISATLSSDETECHAALYNMSGQQIIYPSSGTCIILNPGDQQMMVSFQKHDTTVAAICTSNSRQLVASADSNSVRIWQSQTRNEVATLTFERQQCVALLSFSSDDMKLVCLCSGGLFVWMTMNGDWNKAHLAFHTLAGREKVHFALYDTSQTIIVSGGRGHVNFWTEQHSTLALSKAVLPQNLEDGTFFCGIAVNDKIVTGTSRGSIVIWQGSKVVQDIQAHGVGVTSLCACPEGFLSGSAAGIVILWTSSLQKVSSFDAAELPPSPIRSLDMFPSLKRTATMKVLVRSEAGDIYEISCVTGNVSLLCNLRSNDIPTAVENPTVPADVTM